MSIKKQYSRTGSTCKVTFSVEPAAELADTASLVGEFNGWDPDATPMKRRKDGSFVATVELPRGSSNEFRYLMNGTQWRNDENADRYVPTPHGDCDNCVVDV